MINVTSQRDEDEVIDWLSVEFPTILKFIGGETKILAFETSKDYQTVKGTIIEVAKNSSALLGIVNTWDLSEFTIFYGSVTLNNRIQKSLYR